MDIGFSIVLGVVFICCQVLCLCCDKVAKLFYLWGHVVKVYVHSGIRGF